MKMQSAANRITKRTAKPETQWNPDDRVALGPAAEPINPPAPFVPCDSLLVIPNQKPRGFPTVGEAAEAACDFAEANPGVWVEVYARLSDSPGWYLNSLIGIPAIEAAFAAEAPGQIQRVTVDADSCSH